MRTSTPARHRRGRRNASRELDLLPIRQWWLTRRRRHRSDAEVVCELLVAFEDPVVLGNRSDPHEAFAALPPTAIAGSLSPTSGSARSSR